jgi:hypothetical protein
MATFKGLCNHPIKLFIKNSYIQIFVLKHIKNDFFSNKHNDDIFKLISDTKIQQNKIFLTLKG